MKSKTFLTGFLIIFAAELAALFIFAAGDVEDLQDAVQVNEAVQSVQEDWDAIEKHENQTDLDYTVLGMDGTVIYKTEESVSETVNEAVIHRDTVLELKKDGAAVGKIIIYNDSAENLKHRQKILVMFLAAGALFQCALCAGYFLYLNHVVIKPFHKLHGFAERIAGGNLDIPLEMDRKNLFGAFTESFDIMRSELRRARKAEAAANAAKKEMVAKLSHDIKTPVASIKAASEVGAALADNERLRENYTQIICKADQINTLISNLFTATLEELEQLPVMPEDMESREIGHLLEYADYLGRADIPDIPDCILYADQLRLQQVFDNIFANSYKYAGTPIVVSAFVSDGCMTVRVEDSGGGVSREELPLIKEKFRRGSNAKKIEGAGLGLYISDHFMEEMHGSLVIENGEKGLRVSVRILLSPGEIFLGTVCK